MATTQTTTSAKAKVIPLKPKAKAAAPKAEAKAKAAPKPKAEVEVKVEAPKVKAKAAPAKAVAENALDNTAKIKVLVKDNPHRKGSLDANRYGKLKSGMTVADAKEEEGMTTRYLRYAEGRGIISIG